MTEFLISDAKYVLTVDDKRRMIRDGAVAVDGTDIVDVGKSSELKRKYPGAERIDAKNKMVMPGLFDCHAHTCDLSYCCDQGITVDTGVQALRSSDDCSDVAITNHGLAIYFPHDMASSWECMERPTVWDGLRVCRNDGRSLDP